MCDCAFNLCVIEDVLYVSRGESSGTDTNGLMQSQPEKRPQKPQQRTDRPAAARCCTCTLKYEACTGFLLRVPVRRTKSCQGVWTFSLITLIARSFEASLRLKHAEEQSFKHSEQLPVENSSHIPHTHAQSTRESWEWRERRPLLCGFSCEKHTRQFYWRWKNLTSQ